MFAILRAHPVAVLRDFPGHPIFFGKRRDQVAHQLCLPDAPRMSADHDHPPPHGYFPLRVRAFRGEFLFFFASNSLMRPASSGKRAYQAYASLNLPISRAGVPQTVWPARMVLPVGIPACAPAMAPSSSVQWSAMPTCPPTITPRPSTVLPETPVCEARI